MRSKKNGSAADYRTFALDFSEKSDYLVKKWVISKYKRVILFLQAFNNKIGDMLRRKHNIDMKDPDTTDNVFADLKRDALNLCCDDDLQITKMWKKEQEPEVQHPFQQQREEQEREKSNRQRKQLSSKKPDEVEDLAEMMKNLKIFQLEKQVAELARVNQRNRQQTNQDQQAEKEQNSTALPFSPPNQYGNRYYPNQQNQQGQ